MVVSLLTSRGSRRRAVKCFPSAELGRLGLNALPERTRPIDVDKIVGTVDRCNELTPTFLPKKEGYRSARYRSVLQAIKSDVPLPPIEVYQLRREYYVLDGHHRVAAAIHLDVAFFDAVVRPIVLPDSSVENRLHNRRTLFARRTGLQHVELSDPAAYARALSIIEASATGPDVQGLSYHDAARRWYDRVYKPLVTRVEAGGLLDDLQGETAGDVVVHLYNGLWAYGGSGFSSRQAQGTERLPSGASAPGTDSDDSTILEKLSAALDDLEARYSTRRPVERPVEIRALDALEPLSRTLGRLPAALSALSSSPPVAQSNAPTRGRRGVEGDETPDEPDPDAGTG